MNSILFAHADYIFAHAEYIISTVEYMFALGNKDFFIINKLLTYYNIYILRIFSFYFCGCYLCLKRVAVLI